MSENKYERERARERGGEREDTTCNLSQHFVF